MVGDFWDTFLKFGAPVSAYLYYMWVVVLLCTLTIMIVVIVVMLVLALLGNAGQLSLALYSNLISDIFQMLFISKRPVARSK